MNEDADENDMAVEVNRWNKLEANKGYINYKEGATRQWIAEELHMKARIKKIMHARGPERI